VGALKPEQQLLEIFRRWNLAASAKSSASAEMQRARCGPSPRQKCWNACRKGMREQHGPLLATSDGREI